jgi:outer membrane immunogenic protein
MLATSSFAADLPSSKSPPVFAATPANFDWSGFYIGAEGGVAFQGIRGPIDGLEGPAPYHIARNATQLGALLGYNHQIGSMVVGLDGDVDALSGPADRAASADHLGNIYNISGTETYNADVRARIGYALGRSLIYLAGGVAFGSVNVRYAGGQFSTLPSSLSYRTDRAGWTLGGGVEYAFTNDVIGRAEYRYTDLGSARNADQNVSFSDNPRFNSSAVTAALIFKFGDPEKFAAKY